MEITRGWKRTSAAVLGAGLVVSSLAARGIGGDVATPVIEGLQGVRGVAVGPANRLLFTEIDGSLSELVTRGSRAGTVTPLGSVPATLIAPALAMGGLGQTFVLTAGGPPGSGAATLYRWTPGAVGARVVADIGAYQVIDPDPFNVTLEPEESNPFGVALLADGSVLVADAANNDILRVFPDGTIVTVARLKPRIVPVPPEIGGGENPPAGTLLPSEAVATSVTLGADGFYYVGELRGFPATPGTSQVWRIAPDSVDAVCDPDAPSTGACQRYADGFTSIVALGAGPDGSIYVVELVKQSWLQWELGLAQPIGGLFRIPPGGGPGVEIAADQLILPGGIDVAKDGTVYVSGPIFGPGAIWRIE